ncbi:serine/threonine protein kinase [Pendulispora albinea]|uniref:non-specific serine/threonine protein kinase n=1 Tax=Pendulispora albinea TaxID=2741071 RepID=A0ABZ2MCA4_9BACT
MLSADFEDPFDLVGDVLDGQFRVDRFAGEGDFTVVYRGHHLGVDAPVAIKCLNVPPTLDAALLEPFLESFRDGARLHYRLALGNLHIARSIAFGTTMAPRTGQSVPYLVREWLEGCSLATDFEERAKEGLRSRTLREVIALLDSAAEALAYAHAQGVVHHSINPRNLFVVPTLEGRVVKVLDFGVAKLLNEHSVGTVSATSGVTHAHAFEGAGLRVMFPSYSAPEQIDRRFGTPGAATDVYALALVIYEALAGAPVVPHNMLFADVLQTFQPNQRPTARGLGVSISGQAEAVLAQALALEPSVRHGNAAEFWRELKNALREESSGKVRLRASYVSGPRSARALRKGHEGHGAGVEVAAGRGVEALGAGGREALAGRGAEALGAGGREALAGRGVEALGAGGREALAGRGVEALGAGGREALAGRGAEALGVGGRETLAGRGVEALGAGGREALAGRGVEALGAGGRGAEALGAGGRETLAVHGADAHGAGGREALAGRGAEAREGHRAEEHVAYGATAPRAGLQGAAGVHGASAPRAGLQGAADVRGASAPRAGLQGAAGVHGSGESEAGWREERTAPRARVPTPSGMSAALTDPSPRERRIWLLPVVAGTAIAVSALLWAAVLFWRGAPARPRLVAALSASASFATRAPLSSAAASLAAAPPALPSATAATAAPAVRPAEPPVSAAAATPALASAPRPRPVRRRETFPREEAARAFERVAADFASCAMPGGPHGPGSVRARFNSDGTLLHVTLAPPYAGTPTGTCIVQRFETITVSPFATPSVAFNYVFTTIP